MLSKGYSVNICGIPYRVIYVGDNFSSSANFGEISYKDCTIKLSDDLSKPMEDVVLIHEIMHGILSNLGYTELNDDETFVQSMAQALNQCMTVKKDYIEEPKEEVEVFYDGQRCDEHIEDSE